MKRQMLHGAVVFVPPQPELFMRLLALFLITIFAGPTLAASFDISDEAEFSKLCSGFEQLEDDHLVCLDAKDVAKVRAAKVGKSVTARTVASVVGAENDPESVYDLGVMGDDSTDTIYVYHRELLDRKTNKRVGYL